MEKKVIDGVQYSIGAFILNDKNEILLLKRFEGDYISGWEMVKGAIHIGETEEEACLREIKEETGLVDVEILKKYDKFFEVKSFKHEKPIHVKSRSFLIKYKSGNVKISKEHENFGWFSLSEGQKIIWDQLAAQKLNEIKQELTP
jgi:dihydroneopterin triphosphate diphosphatase